MWLRIIRKWVKWWLLRNYCRQYLTGYKIPKDIEFRDELPKTNVGKILRRVLRDEEIAKLNSTK